MSRPMAGEGTCRYSTGNPGREKAPAIAEPPVTPIRPGNIAAATAATAARRAVAPRIFCRNSIFLNLHLSGNSRFKQCLKHCL
ncbi:Uncharacterised protein [Mycobacteroides abscessus subsp. abscessus]|nr:Uncharacterised protein [Mycobacteroides abscessus subsp. abscessus]